jgi:hypothetical protein
MKNRRKTRVINKKSPLEDQKMAMMMSAKHHDQKNLKINHD